MKKPKCPKCDSPDTRTRYHVGGWDAGHGDNRMCHSDNLEDRKGEHLHIYCNNCLFDWTIDTIKGEEDGE